jgi:hypothetical protein
MAARLLVEGRLVVAVGVIDACSQDARIRPVVRPFLPEVRRDACLATLASNGKGRLGSGGPLLWISGMGESPI